MSSVVELLEQIAERPGMYIGKRSAIRLHVFLQGWLLGRGDVDDSEVLRVFQQWVSNKYKIETMHSWAEIITFFSEDDVDAFEKFYALFREFRSL